MSLDGLLYPDGMTEDSIKAAASSLASNSEFKTVVDYLKFLANLTLLEGNTTDAPQNLLNYKAINTIEVTVTTLAQGRTE